MFMPRTVTNRYPNAAWRYGYKKPPESLVPGTNDLGAEILTQVGFEPTTHALKGRCSTN